MNKQDKLIEIAKGYIGTKEDGGDNKGTQVEEFQKAVDGKAVQESWCLSFVQYCVKKTDKELGGNENKLANTEHVLTLWRNTPKELRLAQPEEGSIMCWEHYKNGVATGLGHCGVVSKVNRNGTVDTVEGNTSDGSGIVRNGDGVYARNRSITSSVNSTMKVLGWLKPWAEDKDLLPNGPSDEEINVKLEDIEKEIL